MRRLVRALPILVVLVACGSDDDDAGTAGGTVPTVTDPGEPSTSGPPSTTPSPSTAPPSFSVKPSPSPPLSTTARSTLPGTPIDATLPVVVAAVEDLAGRLGIEPDAVTVIDASAVTWPDGSLGCPEPGMMYTQVLVDGMLVVLEADGRQYEYHGGDPLFLCEQSK
jgi:hypothetical protein